MSSNDSLDSGNPGALPPGGDRSDGARLWPLLRSETVADLILFKARFDWFTHPRSGTVFKRLVLPSGDWVNVVARTGDGQLVMVRQFRFGTACLTLETPGGMVDPGEAHGDAAARELLEETGYGDGNWVYLGAVQPNPAIHDHLCHHWLADGVRQIFFMLLPASAFLLVLGEPAVRLVYQRAEFDAASTALTSTALVYFAIGLAFNGASLLVIRAFFSMQMPAIATKVAALGVVLNLALDAALYRPLGTGGIPLSTSIASVVTFLMLIWLLERELGGLHRAWMLDGVMRSVAASGVSVLLAWATWRTLDDALGRGTAAQIATMALTLAAAAAGHLAAAQAFEMHELRALSRLRRPLQ